MADIESQARLNSVFTDEEIVAAEREASLCGDRFTAQQLLGPQAASSVLAGDYQVIWLPSARSQLEQAAASKQDEAIAEPVQRVSKLLSESPSQKGDELLGRTRLAQAGSFQVLYRVDEPDKLVTVLGLKRSGQA